MNLRLVQLVVSWMDCGGTVNRVNQVLSFSLDQSPGSSTDGLDHWEPFLMH